MTDINNHNLASNTVFS